MLTETRMMVYDPDWPDKHALAHLTLRQIKRLRHKNNCRKTHEHNYLMVLTGERKGKKVTPDGELFRCLRCRPLPWSVSAAIKPEDGPRDWTPPDGGQ
jgi:hypothetical protein